MGNYCGLKKKHFSFLGFEMNLKKAQIVTRQATEDEDVLTVNTSVSLARDYDSVIVYAKTLTFLIL